MADLNPRLQVALYEWQQDLREAEGRGAPGGEVERIRGRTIRAFVESALDNEALARLGLKVSSRTGHLVIGELALAEAERLARAPGVDQLSPDQPIKPQLDDSVPQIRAPSVWNGTPSYKGRRVLVGIIDTGVDIFHDSFRLPDRSKSRIISIWDQAAAGGPNPPGFAFGVEYNKAQIETALAVDVAHPGTATFPHTDSSWVGGVRVETGGHGTHVLSTAAGDGSPVDTCDFPFTFVGVAPEADLIVVRPLGLQTNVVDGLRYIFDVANRLENPNPPPAPQRPPRPAVVNISLGWNLGPRDGGDPMDVQIDGLLAPGGVGVPRRAVVVSAGNEGQKRRHARKPIAQNGVVQFNFEILAFSDYPRDVSPDQFDIWFDAAASLTLTVTGPPGPAPVTQVMPDGGALPVSGCNVVVSAATVMPNGQKSIFLRISASAANPVAKGPWSFSFQETSGNAATIDIWVDREDNDVFPMFSEADAVRDNTVTIPGTGQSVITVGSYAPDRGEAFDFSLSSFSSWGLQLGALGPGRRLKPDIAAPGEEITAAASGESRKPPPCCQCCNRLHIDMQGTSMAAPHVTGVAALMFEKNPDLTSDQVRAFLQLGASRDSIPVTETPTVLPLDHGGGSIGTPGQPDFKQIFQNNKWGSGRLDALAAVESILLVGGGGGGGGGGGNPAPMFIERDDAALAQLSPKTGFAAWPESLRDHPAFQLLAALVSTHVDEVRRLIDTNKRVAVVWRRGGGPTILRHFVRRNPETIPLVPAAIGEFSISTLLARLMKVFLRFGSDGLRSDVIRWRDFVLAAPGSDLAGLDARLKDTVR